MTNLEGAQEDVYFKTKECAHLFAGLLAGVYATPLDVADRFPVNEVEDGDFGIQMNGRAGMPPRPDPTVYECADLALVNWKYEWNVDSANEVTC